MPTINDATVVNSAYDTSGNGGRKLVRLSDNSLVAVLKDGLNVRINRTTDNWATKTEIHALVASSSLQDVCLSTNGTHIFITMTHQNTAMLFRSIDKNGNQIQNTVIDSGQSAMGNISSIVNSLGTELHATWASKNATYPNSFNIRYAKGTINGDGSVAWGAVEQRSTDNATGANNENPTITLNKNGYPVIIYTFNQGTTGNYLVARAFNGSSWVVSNPYVANGYAQSSPSAIFVPQSVNGLANGRIWVAWQGLDATDSTFNNIRTSYSDDGGATWSAMQKITPSGQSKHQREPSITANKNNEVFIVWYGSVSTIYYDIRKVKYSSGSWGAISNVKDGVTVDLLNPSTLYDSTFSFTEPLFIYKHNNTKVGFYGTWTVTTISVTQGSIGQKTDKANVLTYAITTDGTMSTITEKVNGVTVGTKTATSGQSLIAGLTQAQWDAVKFGKYADATGGKNTLTVEMGTEKWTYTFDKRLATTDDILSAVKAEQDVKNVFLPAVKSKLASAITSKGGTASGTDTWDALESAVGGITLGKKWASGSVTANAGGTFQYAGNATTLTNANVNTISVSGLSFKPSRIIITDMSGDSTSVYRDNGFIYSNVVLSVSNVTVNSNSNHYLFKADTNSAFVNVNGFSLPCYVPSSTLVKWIAFE